MKNRRIHNVKETPASFLYENMVPISEFLPERKPLSDQQLAGAIIAGPKNLVQDSQYFPGSWSRVANQVLKQNKSGFLLTLDCHN